MRSALGLGLGIALTWPGPALSAPAVPGGYRGPAELREPEPPDGDNELLAGSIAFPLGILRAGAGVGQVVAASPRHCRDVYPNASDSTCRSLRTWGYTGIGFGAAMALSGAVLVAVGGVRRQRHAAWRAKVGRVSATVAWKRGLDVSLSFRF